VRRPLLAAAAVAAGAVLAGLLSAPGASALGTPVSGSFLCESSSSSLGGTVVGNPQTLLSTITTPASTSDISSPVKATVTVTAPASGAMPASPPVCARRHLRGRLRVTAGTVSRGRSQLRLRDVCEM